MLLQAPQEDSDFDLDVRLQAVESHGSAANTPTKPVESCGSMMNCPTCYSQCYCRQLRD